MECVIKPYKCLCSLEEFTVNGIKARYEDFGTKRDIDSYNCPVGGCGNMKFIAHRDANPKVLEKYHITEAEFYLICNRLDKALSFGYCGWCS